MPRPVNYPNVFGSLSGQVSASLLDQNFNASGSIINDSASGWVNAAIDTGSANAYMVTLNPPATEYAPGFFISWLPLNANTGPSSINVNNLGNIPILTTDGSALYPGALQPGTVYSMVVINNSFRVIAPDTQNVLIGQVALSGAATWPANWLLCNGAAIGRIQYAGLFKAIGTAYGAGNGSSTFNVPQMAQAFPLYGTPGLSGGNNNTILTQNNLPPHNHVIDVSNPSHTHGYTAVTFGVSGFQLQPLGGGALIGSAASTTSATFTTITATSQNTGSGTSFSNVPQFVCFNFLIRAF